MHACIHSEAVQSSNWSIELAPFNVMPNCFSLAKKLCSHYSSLRVPDNYKAKTTQLSMSLIVLL